MPSELTFSSRRGSAVLTPEGAPATELSVGQRVLVPSLFGYYLATVTIIEFGATYAETSGSFFPLRLENGEWWCESAISKVGLEAFGASLAP
jgi:hypothetical protein